MRKRTQGEPRPAFAWRTLDQLRAFATANRADLFGPGDLPDRSDRRGAGRGSVREDRGWARESRRCSGLAAASQQPECPPGEAIRQWGTNGGVDHRIDHRAGQKASQHGTTHGTVVLLVRCKMPLEHRAEEEPLCWQASDRHVSRTYWNSFGPVDDRRDSRLVFDARFDTELDETADHSGTLWAKQTAELNLRSAVRSIARQPAASHRPSSKRLLW